MSTDGIRQFAQLHCGDYQKTIEAFWDVIREARHDERRRTLHLVTGLVLEGGRYLDPLADKEAHELNDAVKLLARKPVATTGVQYNVEYDDNFIRQKLFCLECKHSYMETGTKADFRAAYRNPFEEFQQVASKRLRDAGCRHPILFWESMGGR